MQAIFINPPLFVHAYSLDFLPNVPDDSVFLDWHCTDSIYRSPSCHCTLWSTHYSQMGASDQ